MSEIAMLRELSLGGWRLPILFAEVHFVEAPHALAKEVSSDGPDEQIYGNLADVINRLVLEPWFSDQVLRGHCDEHKSAPPQHSYPQHEALLSSSLCFLPPLPCLH